MAILQAPEDGYDFVEKPSEDFFCPVTSDLLREPYLTQCCGNHLSPVAVTTLQGQPCPFCREPNLNPVYDTPFESKVCELQVQCPNKNLGCEWVGELGDLDRHLSLNSVHGECQFVTVACPYSCGHDYKRCEIKEHKMNDCPNRPSICEHCDYKATYTAVTREHWVVCKKYPLQCPNACGGDTIQRQHLVEHLHNVCPLEVVECEFSYACCDYQCQRQHMQDHVNENVKAHLLLVSKIVSQKSKEQEELENKIKRQDTRTEELESTIQEQLKTINQQQQQIGPIMTAVALNVQKPLEPVFVPPSDIVMTDFEKHKKVRDRWYSPPFYSHIGGYKLCFTVVAYGWVVCKGIYISVYIYLMRGEHDDCLKWPFRGAITMQLLNQKSDEGHREATFKFDDAVGDEYAGRVVGQERADHGWGCLSFILHSDLNTKEREYLQNDCLKFRIQKIVVRSI